MNTLINPLLFHSFKTGHLLLNNRIIMAPMTRSRAIDNMPGELERIYYTQRATAGLIITEGTAPSPAGLGYSRTPGIYSSGQAAAWKKVTGSVHQQGGKIFVQLMHVGRIAHPDNMPAGTRIIAPSAIAPRVQMWTDQSGMQPIPAPAEMSSADIKDTIHAYAEAAGLAIEAGFDGVEIHGANGYLPEQFLNPHSNTRTDEYGGTLEKRSQFLLELTEAVTNKIGKEKTGVRLSPYSTYNDMPEYDETYSLYQYLFAGLNKLSPAYLHIVEASARAKEEGVDLLKKIRQTFSGTIIANGGYTPEKASEAITAGQADLVSFGSSFIANPDLPYRMQHGIPLAAPDPSLFFSPGEKGYIDYPSAPTALQAE